MTKQALDDEQLDDFRDFANFFQERVKENRYNKLFSMTRNTLVLLLVGILLVCTLPSDLPKWTDKDTVNNLAIIVLFSCCGVYWSFGLLDGMLIYQRARTQTVTEARKRREEGDIDVQTLKLVYIAFHTRPDNAEH
jgi:hypothetical protein